MIIGFSGYATSGKDTAGDVLVEAGYEKRGFADKLRDFALAVNPIVGFERPPWRLKKRPVYYADALEECGYNDAKALYPEVRRALQRMGTEGGRRVFWDNFWVDLALNGVDPKKKYVFTDVRFENEAQGIINNGGVLIRIERYGVGPQSQHPSEISLDAWPFEHTIYNNGAIEDFMKSVIEEVTLIEIGRGTL